MLTVKGVQETRPAYVVAPGAAFSSIVVPFPNLAEEDVLQACFDP